MSNKPDARKKNDAAGSRTPSKQHLRLWLKLLSSTNQIEKTIRARLGNTFNSTLPRFDVLAALEHVGGGLTMGELSSHLLVSNGNVTGVSDRLRRDGLIRRTSPPGDRRVSLVEMTDQGRESFQAMAARHEQWIDEVMCCLSDQETDSLIALLDKVLAHLASEITETRSQCT